MVLAAGEAPITTGCSNLYVLMPCSSSPWLVELSPLAWGSQTNPPQSLKSWGQNLCVQLGAEDSLSDRMPWAGHCDMDPTSSGTGMPAASQQEPATELNLAALLKIPPGFVPKAIYL